jgi:hypothetical protein
MTAAVLSLGGGNSVVIPFRPFECYQQAAGSDHFMDCLQGLRGGEQYPPSSSSCNLDGEDGTLAMAWLQGVTEESSGVGRCKVRSFN